MGINRRRLRLGDLLISQGIITEEQLQKGLQLQKEKGCKLGEALVEGNIVSEETIVKTLGEQLHLSYVDLANVKIEDEILDLVPSALLKKHMMLPFEYAADNPNVIRVAMVDPLDIEATDDINIVTNHFYLPPINREYYNVQRLLYHHLCKKCQIPERHSA